jgi:putative OPT family oligopeptide transporter
MDPKQMLSAPQAALMATLVQGVFLHNLPWPMINIGFAIAIGCITIDSLIKKQGLRLPVLAVGLGIYLPLYASVPLVIGGISSFFIDHALRRRHKGPDEITHEAIRHGQQRGLILACGVVAGAALMGVILAIPFAIAQSNDVLRLVGDSFTPIANTLGVLVTIGLIGWFYKVVCQKDKVK